MIPIDNIQVFIGDEFSLRCGIIQLKKSGLFPIFGKKHPDTAYF